MDESYIRIGSNYEQVMEKLGVAILKDQFRLAAYALFHATTPAYRAQAISEALAFIRGSGLEEVVEAFELDVNPTKFRETFWTWATHRQAHHPLALSSLTIADGS